MSCYDILDQLIKQAQACPGGHSRWCNEGYNPPRSPYDRILQGLDKGRKQRQEFLQTYPFRESPAAVASLTPIDVYNPGHESFFKSIGSNLIGALGGAGRPAAFRNAAGPYLEQLKELLRIALDDSRTLAEKIDAPWEKIPRFGGDRQIAKKIVSTYYPDKSLHIFDTARMECHAKHLGIDIDAECMRKYGLHYADPSMTVGKKWELLTEVLLERKAHHPTTRDEDNAYFMFILEHKPCRPDVAG